MNAECKSKRGQSSTIPTKAGPQGSLRDFIGAFYERNGGNWQTFETAGYNGPEISVIVDQADATSYSTAANDDGFITIGSVEVDVEPPEVATIVIRLRSVKSDESRSGASSSLLISDAVMLKKAE